MNMNKTLEAFYLSLLDYAGLEMVDNVFTPKDERLGKFTLDGKHITLPYDENLRNPGDNHIFHPLNESFSQPETTMFALFKDKLVLDINLKLAGLVISLLRLCAEPMLQQRVKRSAFVDVIAKVGDVEMTFIEDFTLIVAAGKKKRGVGFLVDFFLKKDGTLDEKPFSAIGKVNFHIVKELKACLEDPKKEYRVYGAKVRRKSVECFIRLFDTLFEANNLEEKYTIGTDHKPFRYFNALLKVTYLITDRVNQVVEWFKDVQEPSLEAEAWEFDTKWVSVLEDVYNLTNEIRMIPNQTNIESEGIGRIAAKEPAPWEEDTRQPPMNTQPPRYTPPVVQERPQQPMHQPQAQPVHYPAAQPQPQQMVPQQPSAPSVEDIIRGQVAQQTMMPYMNSGMGMMQQPMQPMAGMPGMQPMYPPVAAPMQNQVIQTQQGPMVVTPQGLVPAMNMPMANMQPQMINTPQGQMIVTQQGMFPAQNFVPGVAPQPMMQPGMMMQQPMQPQGGLMLDPNLAPRGYYR